MTQITNKKINDLLKYKCFSNIFFFVDQCNDWRQENWNPCYLFFYKCSLHLLEKGNTKLAKSILPPVINSVYGNVVSNSVYTYILYVLCKDDDFSPLNIRHLLNISKKKYFYKIFLSSFSKCSEKITFPKKLCLNIFFLVLSGKMIFLFDDDIWLWHLCLVLKITF